MSYHMKVTVTCGCAQSPQEMDTIVITNHIAHARHKRAGQKCQHKGARPSPCRGAGKVGKATRPERMWTL